MERTAGRTAVPFVAPAVTPFAAAAPGNADLALLSDCQSAALVDGSGSVTWLCLPRFDSPAAFASLLEARCGHWSIRPAGLCESTRRYLPDSLVLETTFVTPTGRAVLTDALLLGDGERGHDIGRGSPHVLVRRIEMLEGRDVIDARFAPRGQYGSVEPQWHRRGPALVADLGHVGLTLCGPAPDEPPDGSTGDSALWSRELTAGQSLTFSLLGAASGDEPAVWSDDEMLLRLADTEQAWRSWSQLHPAGPGRWREHVRDSGRVLQGLTFAPTGAVIAAPTPSLPMRLHREPSSDHRYACLRDASALAAVHRAGVCTAEAARQVSWLVDTVGGGPAGGLQPVLGVDGALDVTQERLAASPNGWQPPATTDDGRWQRRGTEAAGELLAAVYLLRAHIEPPSGERRDVLAGAVAAIGPEPSPGGARTALMDWLALDRAAALPEWFDLTAAGPSARLRKAATQMGDAVLRRGWDASTRGYTGFHGRSLVEASALLLSLYGLVSATDPVMRRTVELVADRLSAPCGLIYRDEDSPDLEGPSLVCTFWLVEYLVEAGEPDRAEAIFEQAVAYANDVGLLSQYADPRTGELLGHFPRASSHAGLISAATSLERRRVTRPGARPRTTPPR